MSPLKASVALWRAFLLVILVTGCGSSDQQSNGAAAVEQMTELTVRQGEVLTDLVLVSGLSITQTDTVPALVSIEPELPQGLTLDVATATINGAATRTQPPLEYTLSVQTLDSVKHYPLTLAVTDPLPDSFEFLAAGFNAKTIVSDAAMPVRMALAPDGRLFYIELQSGNIRIVDPQQGLLPQPFAEVDIVAGQERGMLGLALDPDFETNGYVYINATVAGHDELPEHAVIIRFTAVGNAATERTVIMDHLPSADVRNGGDIVFDHEGHLFIGRGDIADPATSQADGGLSGRILRITKDGGIPADNPYADDPEWCRGLRNTFALAVHPVTGDLFGADAGPVSDDKLNYLQPGKNFLWGIEEEPGGSSIGYSVEIWDEVVTPTAMFFHRGEGAFYAYENQLFLSSYNFGDIRVMHVDGTAFTDLIREETFAEFKDQGIANKPLHLVEREDGGFYVSTFDGIYLIY